jgi:hypothetical protein
MDPNCDLYVILLFEISFLSFYFFLVEVTAPSPAPNTHTHTHTVTSVVVNTQVFFSCSDRLEKPSGL